MAIVIAIIIAVVTIGFAILQLFAAGMSDAPGASSGAGWTLGIGLVIAALVLASHWLHWSW